MELLARARIVMWQGASLWIVDATPLEVRETKRTDFHAHHAVQVTLALDGRFRLETKDAHVRGDAVAVAADVQHAFEPEGLMAIIFIEPESRLGRAVARRLFDGAQLAAIPAELLGDLRERIRTAYRSTVRNDATLVSLGQRLVTALGADAAAVEPDIRIRKVIAWAAAQHDGAFMRGFTNPTWKVATGVITTVVSVGAVVATRTKTASSLAKVANGLRYVEKEIIGTVKLPAGFKYGTTDGGKAIHPIIGDLLEEQLRAQGVTGIINRSRGEAGPDLSIDPIFAKQAGLPQDFEFKPNTSDGIKAFNQQSAKWMDRYGINPADVGIVTYDANGVLRWGWDLKK